VSFSNLGLAGRNVVVTGAGRGLGAALAIVLADLGAEPILCARKTESLGKTAALIAERTGRRPLAVSLDLADTKSVADAALQIADQSQTIDALVNNGAAWLAARRGPYTAEEVAGVMNAALTGTFLFTQALLPRLMGSERPDIVTIGSISALPNMRLLGASVPFQAAKHGQLGLIDGLRQMLAGTKVRSIGVHPPDIEDVSPAEAAWEASPRRQKGEGVTNRDVVEAVIFALTRPRSVTLSSIVLDADKGGIFDVQTAAD